MRYYLIFMFFSSIAFGDLKIGEPAPTFFLRTLEEERFFMSDTLAIEQPIVLSFFATWCIPCREEIPVLDSVRQQFPNMKFYLIDVSGLNTNGKAMIEDSLMVSKMINFLKVDMLVLMDIYGKTAEKYNVKELPTLIVIDPKGMISYMHTGYKKGDENELISILNGFAIEKK